MIVTILELQNQGKLQECSQCAPPAPVRCVCKRLTRLTPPLLRRLQARLQQNLMYLAAIADKTAGIVPSSAAAAAPR